MIVALFAGVAGMISLTTAKSGALIGVLISVTTIPAAGNIGLAAAYGNWDEFRGASAQLAINLVCIVAAGLATLGVQRLLFARRARGLSVAATLSRLRRRGSAPARRSRARTRAGRPRRCRGGVRRRPARPPSATRRRARPPPSAGTPRPPGRGKPDQAEDDEARQVAEDAEAGRGRLFRLCHLLGLELLAELARDRPVAVEEGRPDEACGHGEDEVAAERETEHARGRLVLGPLSFVSAPAILETVSAQRAPYHAARATAPPRFASPLTPSPSSSRSRRPCARRHTA